MHQTDGKTFGVSLVVCPMKHHASPFRLFGGLTGSPFSRSSAAHRQRFFSERQNPTSWLASTGADGTQCIYIYAVLWCL